MAGGNLYGLDKLLCTQLEENMFRSWSAIGETFYKLEKKAIEALLTRNGELLGNEI